MNVLSDRHLAPGRRWIYSAGFNVRPDLADTARIDTELADLTRLSGSGGRIAVLSHQGSYRDGTATHLRHVADYLGVEYVPDNTSDAAIRRARAMVDGEIVLFGNTRLHRGEEDNDPALARRFAELGNAVVVGGFAKAHRAHASNVGILRYRPGVAAAGLARDIEAIAPWAGIAEGGYSVAVLGGRKREKITIGLAYLTRSYDLVIPGGAVLNTLLAVQGHRIGASAAFPDCADLVASVLARRNRARIHLPDTVIVAAPDGTRRPVRVADGVPDGHRIVGFELRERLGRIDRALLAGPPTLPGDQGELVPELLAAFRAPGVRAMLMGGDTAAELPWEGPISTGGGSALHYLATGTCAVLDALGEQCATNATDIRPAR